ncbi:serine carboxypeptidase [Trametopsis cervina]|nr:serine carboxypeptidase [Trametopsis cervina]
MLTTSVQHFMSMVFAKLKFSSILLSYALLAADGARAIQQEPLSQGSLQNFAPFGSLDALSSTEFTTLRHPLVPAYGMRVKKSKEFCDGTVNAYTGYIDISTRHLFFYFFESRRDPKKDDVIFWTNGGPGCSSTTGLFMELGPCRVTSVNETIFNPYSWNEVANTIFIDQPIGTGFSYADFGEYVSTTEEAAADIAAFMFLFFQHFVTFTGRALHMAGESYAGRMIPTFASYIYEQNKRLIENGATPVNLKSIMLGNGCTDWLTMLPSFYNVGCEHHSAPPVIDISTCVHLKRILPQCEKGLKDACYDTTDSINCQAAWNFCSQLAFAYDKTGYNPYDITKKCEGDYKDTMCYPITKDISSFLSQPSVRETIGIDEHPSIPQNYSGCTRPIHDRFWDGLDQVLPAHLYIEQLLARDIRVLIYAGDVDWICNWIGNERMTLRLDWAGKEAFASQPLREWNVTSDSDEAYAAGMTRSEGLLTYATIHGGGHMAPYDRPRESLELVKRWLNGEQL